MHRKIGAKVKLLGKATEFERHHKPTISLPTSPPLKERGFSKVCYTSRYNVAYDRNVYNFSFSLSNPFSLIDMGVGSNADHATPIIEDYTI
jgi:hypothetical protein